jgi:cobalamin biosynthetic protein CobC
VSSINKASNASGAATTPPSGPQPPIHGGDLGAARKLFPNALEPFLDLSAGINPHPFPFAELRPDIFSKLPQPDELAALLALAAEAYGAPSPAYVAAGPGSQVLVAQTAFLLARGRAAVLAPTYAEHGRAAELAGHNVVAATDLGQLVDSRIAIVVNPNNPDGRLTPKDSLLALADRLRRRGGLLLVDEAFMEVGPEGASLADHVEEGNIVVLRSFGKFYGLAGLRLSFALAAPEIAARIGIGLGPWPVSSAALAIGAQALAATEWQAQTRKRLIEAALRLDACLVKAGLEVIGGTSLFRLVRSRDAAAVFQTLGEAGIMVRRFAEQPTWLRFGLPGAESEWKRLERALAPTPA